MFATFWYVSVFGKSEANGNNELPLSFYFACIVLTLIHTLIYKLKIVKERHKDVSSLCAHMSDGYPTAICSYCRECPCCSHTKVGGKYPLPNITAIYGSPNGPVWPKWHKQESSRETYEEIFAFLIKRRVISGKDHLSLFPIICQQMTGILLPSWQPWKFSVTEALSGFLLDEKDALLFILANSHSWLW